VSALHASGGGRLVAVACVDGHGEPLMPCGRCRQLLWEHGGAKLLVDHADGPVTMADLLPHAFDEIDLGRVGHPATEAAAIRPPGCRRRCPAASAAGTGVPAPGRRGWAAGVDRLLERRPARRPTGLRLDHRGGPGVAGRRDRRRLGPGADAAGGGGRRAGSAPYWAGAGERPGEFAEEWRP
jgi:hypothetical protein